MHIAPFAYLLCSYNVIVGHIHTAGIGYVSIYHHNLAVIARPDMVDPGKAYWVKLVDVDAVVAQATDVMLL